LRCAAKGFFPQAASPLKSSACAAEMTGEDGAAGPRAKARKS